MAISRTAAKKLRELYVDCEVILYMKNMNAAVPTNEGTIDVTAMIQVYVIDIDQEFIYTGLPDGTILRTIGHDTVAMIEIAVPEVSDIRMELPSDSDEVH